MLQRDALGNVTVSRGHRRAGTVPVREEGRHFAIAAIVVAVVAAAAAGYGAYAKNQAEQKEMQARKQASQQEADAERAAGAAAAARIKYNAEQKQRGFLSREAGSGAMVGTGSLLEEEGRFAYNTQLNADEAEFPHKQRAAQIDYQTDLFSFQQKQLKKNLKADVAMAGLSSSVKSYSSLASRSSTSPSTTEDYSGTRSSDTKGGEGIVSTG